MQRGDLARPSGKRHSLSHLLIFFLVMRLITFQETLQRVNSQPDFAFFQDNEAVMRMIM